MTLISEHEAGFSAVGAEDYFKAGLRIEVSLSTKDAVEITTTGGSTAILPAPEVMRAFREAMLLSGAHWDHPELFNLLDRAVSLEDAKQKDRERRRRNKIAPVPTVHEALLRVQMRP